MKKKLLCNVVLLFLLAATLSLSCQSESLGVGENNKGLQLISTKYPPHEYEIVVVERVEETTNEHMLQSTFKGPGGAAITFTGSFVGTVRIGGAITFGSVIFPGTINSTAGLDTTKSISLSQTYKVQMGEPVVYILTACPRYEYCHFHIRRKKDGKIVEKGKTERPVGLECTHYTEGEWKNEQDKRVTEKHDEKKPISFSDRTSFHPTKAVEMEKAAEAESVANKIHQRNQEMSVLTFLGTLGA